MPSARSSGGRRRPDGAQPGTHGVLAGRNRDLALRGRPEPDRRTWVVVGSLRAQHCLVSSDGRASRGRAGLPLGASADRPEEGRLARCHRLTARRQRTGQDRAGRRGSGGGPAVPDAGPGRDRTRASRRGPDGDQSLDLRDRPCDPGPGRSRNYPGRGEPEPDRGNGDWPGRLCGPARRRGDSARFRRAPEIGRGLSSESATGCVEARCHSPACPTG